MNEKRFRSVGGSLYDDEEESWKKCIGNFKHTYECEKVCSLLNKQDVEIKRLKRQLQEIIDYAEEDGEVKQGVVEKVVNG